MCKGPGREGGSREAWQRWWPWRNMGGDEAGPWAGQEAAELVGQGVRLTCRAVGATGAVNKGLTKPPPFLHENLTFG